LEKVEKKRGLGNWGTCWHNHLLLAIHCGALYVCVAINCGCIMCLRSEICQMVAVVLGADVRLPGCLRECDKREMKRRAKKHQSFISLTAAILLTLHL